jgi:hypothetical protein
MRVRPSLLALATVAAVAAPLAAQQAPPPVARLVATPARLTMTAGQTTQLVVTAFDAQGAEIAQAPVRVAGARRAVMVTGTEVKALTAGSHVIVATAPGAGDQVVTLEIPVLVTWEPVSRLEIAAEPGRLDVGVMLAHTAKGYMRSGDVRPGLAVTWRSSDPAVASVDRFGNVTAIKPGPVTITAEAEGVRATRTYTVRPNPVATVEIGIAEATINTGDVIHLKATAKAANGQPVPDAKIDWTFNYTPDDTTVGPGATANIDWGRFVAAQPGRYTLVAQAGSVLARHVVEVKPRDVRRRFTVTGRGPVTQSHTSDLWPWAGLDGRDYVLVGTWGGDGYAYVWDITDLNNLVKTDSIKVDARIINDVTVSPDGRYGVLSREGASNRVNGVVILDLKNPAHPTVAARFDEDLTGGVHNLFATNDYLYAISGGAKYIIIDVRDITRPRKVGEYKHPNARIHDLWVNDGIAYSAQGGVGAVIVDVGNGKWGGTPEKPVLINTFPVNSGHEIFPYFQKRTGKVYLFLGDEEMSRTGRVWEGTNYRGSIAEGGGVAQTSGGYTHIVDITDPMNPRKVGRYHLEDYGTHDIIVEDDILYQAYYDGGVRIVDVSGELMGNIAEQRREIAVFKPFDPKAFTPNASFVMNAMPWKGRVLFTDFNSGLWAAKLEPRPTPVP